MATTYIVSNSNSDLSGGADFTKAAVKSGATTGSVACSIAKSATEISYAFTPSADPSTVGTTGDYTVELDISSGNSSVYCAVNVARVNSSGTQQSVSSDTSEQQLSSAQVYTFSLSSINLGTWASGDRLRIAFKFRNSGTKANSVTVDFGTTDSQVTAPWTIQDATASPAGVSATTAYGSTTESGQASNTPTGVESDTTLGTSAGTGASVASPAGVSAQSALGTAMADGEETNPDANATPVGVESASALGTAASSGSANDDAEGLPAVSALGEPVTTGDAAASNFGLAAVIDLGTVTAAEVLPDGTAEPAGVSASLSLGAVTASASGGLVAGVIGPVKRKRRVKLAQWDKNSFSPIAFLRGGRASCIGVSAVSKVGRVSCSVAVSATGTTATASAPIARASSSMLLHLPGMAFAMKADCIGARVDVGIDVRGVSVPSICSPPSWRVTESEHESLAILFAVLNETYR